MRLRPATPLTILLVISFVLLLLSVLSTPIIKSIPIAKYQGVNFGVFGYCTATKCSGIRVGYTTDGLFGSGTDGGFNLPSNARHSLSSLLVVHPIAAFFNLVCLALAVAAHFHSPSHSARYLLGLLILLLPTLLVTLLAFLVDILLFVPHLQWAGWIVLASTILIAASGVVTCAMRRTLVSRKARKKRIAENAEMSGENFYNRQAQESKLVPTFTADSNPPMVNGAPGADRLPTFATFDTGKGSDEDRQPLRPAIDVPPPVSRDDSASRLYGPPSRSNSRPPYDGPRDQNGNLVLPPQRDADGSFPGGPGSRPGEGRGGVRRSPHGSHRDDSLPPPRGGFGPRGRGNYPPPRGGYAPRGGFGSRGPPPPQGYPGRGGFSTEMRGGYTSRGRGGYPPGAVAAGAGGAMAAAGMMDRGPRRPPPGYPAPVGDISPDRYTPPDGFPDRMGPGGPPLELPSANPYAEGNEGRYEPNPSRYDAAPPDPNVVVSPYGNQVQTSLPASMPSLHPAGQAVEMDSQSPVRAPNREEYIPPRTNWADVRHATPPSNDNFSQPRSPSQYRHGPPSELPPARSASEGYRGQPRRRVNSGGSDAYYEDVDPRFAPESEAVAPIPSQPERFQEQNSVPPLLRPGHDGGPQYHPSSELVHSQLPPTNSYEDLPGARSPAESDASNFTSVSQRGINPNWRPGNGGEFSSLGPARRQNPQMRRDVLLAGNPDFEIPGIGGPGRAFAGRGRGGMRGGMMGGGAPGRIPPASAVGMGADGRYPMAPLPPGPGGVPREI